MRYRTRIIDFGNIKTTARYNASAVAELLQIDVSGVYKMVKRGQLRPVNGHRPGRPRRGVMLFTGQRIMEAVDER